MSTSKAIAIWFVEGSTGEYETCPWVFAAFKTEAAAKACADALNAFVAALPDSPERNDDETVDDYNARWCDWADERDRVMRAKDAAWSAGGTYYVQPVPIPTSPTPEAGEGAA